MLANNDCLPLLLYLCCCRNGCSPCGCLDSCWGGSCGWSGCGPAGGWGCGPVGGCAPFGWGGGCGPGVGAGRCRGCGCELGGGFGGRSWNSWFSRC